MKKYIILLILLLSTFAYSQSMVKNMMLITIHDKQWITSSVAKKITELAEYMYNIKIIEKTPYGYITDDSTEVWKNINIEADVYLNITSDASTNKIRAYGNFKNGTFDLSSDIKDTEEWVEYFSGKTLEKIAENRFLYDKTWDILQLTYWKGVDEYPIYSNGKLYFISDRYSGNREVNIINFKTGYQSTIQLELSSEYFPDVSPNGKYIVFQTSMFGKWDIVLYNTETTEFKRLSPEGLNAYSPYFYDDTLILFSMGTKENKNIMEIWLYDILNDEVKQLTNDKTIMKFRPVKWNKNKIAFYGQNLKDADLNIYYIENVQIKTLLNGEYNQADSWSDGSKFLVYSQFQFGNFRIFSYDNKNIKNLTYMLSDDCYYPSFSPDKKFVFFGVYYKDKEPDIFVIRRN